jgi:hypothetical protein
MADDRDEDPSGDSFVARLREPAAWYSPARRRWTGWLPAALAVAVLGLAAVAGANVAVNPRADFDGRWYPPLVGDDPLEKVDRYEALDTPPHRIVLGSSRAGMLPPSNATALGYNFAIPGGGLRDAALVYDFVVARQGPPQAVVLGLDSFQFSARDLKDVAVEHSKAGRILTDDQRSAAESVGLLAGTLAPGYAYDSLRSLRYAHLSGYPERSRYTGEDGVQVWSGVERQRALGTFDLAQRIDDNWEQGLEGRYAPDALPEENAVAVARDLVARMVADGVRVQVVLLPFHPDVRDRLDATETFAPLHATALTVAREACGPTVEAFDLTDPAVAGIEPSEFYDGTHLDPAGAAKAAAALEAGTGRICGGTP